MVDQRNVGRKYSTRHKLQLQWSQSYRHWWPEQMEKNDQVKSKLKKIEVQPLQCKNSKTLNRAVKEGWVSSEWKGEWMSEWKGKWVTERLSEWVKG